MINSKKFLIVLIFGFIISIFLSHYNLENFDRHDGVEKKHLMVMGDINLIWKEAETFKRDFFEQDKSFLESGKEYTRTFLPSKILAIYSKIFNINLYENYEKNIVAIGGKYFYLIFQSILYYLSVIFFYLKLREFYKNENLSFYVLLFLCLEPTIMQWHSTFWTESIYLSLQLILFSLIISKNKSFINFLCLGIVSGLMFYQKTVFIFLIFPIIIYFLSIKFDKKILKIILILITYGGFLLVLGFSNLKKTGVFYILPLQTKDAHYIHLLPQILEKKGLEIDFDKFLIEEEEKWKYENNFNEDNFEDEIKFNNYRQSLMIEEIKDNKIITLQIYMKKIFHHALLNPVQTFYWHEYNKTEYEIEYHLSQDKKKWLFFRVIYSATIYLIIFFGLKRMLRDSKKIKFHLFLILCLIYYALILGWVGNTRYFVPSIMILSIFFSNGIYTILNFNKKNEIN